MLPITGVQKKPERVERDGISLDGMSKAVSKVL